MKKMILFDFLLFSIIILLACEKQSTIPDQPVNGYYPLDLGGLSEQEMNKFSETLKTKGLPDYSVNEEYIVVNILFVEGTTQNEMQSILDSVHAKYLNNSFLGNYAVAGLPYSNGLASLRRLAKDSKIKYIEEKSPPPRPHSP